MDGLVATVAKPFLTSAANRILLLQSFLTFAKNKDNFSYSNTYQAEMLFFCKRSFFFV